MNKTSEFWCENIQGNSIAFETDKLFNMQHIRVESSHLHLAALANNFFIWLI